MIREAAHVGIEFFRAGAVAGRHGAGAETPDGDGRLNELNGRGLVGIDLDGDLIDGVGQSVLETGAAAFTNCKNKL